MRPKKIKFTKTNKVNISYEETNKSTSSWDEYSLTCADAPRPELLSIMQALKIHVIKMCELPIEYLNRITVTGVTFSYAGENDVMGATITAQMQLEFSNCDLNLNTPHKASESYNINYEADDKQLLSDDCVEALDKLWDEIDLYIKGERAQTNLFAIR